MRYAFVLVMVLVPTLLCGQDTRPTSRPRRPRVDIEQMAKGFKGAVSRISIPSKLMPKEVTGILYKPPGYDLPENAKRRWPVVFFLHGLFENADRWVQRGGTLMLEKAILDDEFPGCLVVAPDAGMTFYCDSLDGKRPYARWFVEECVPWVDQQYRTLGTREGRALLGSSMGGFGALHYAFMRPELFAAVAVHSAAILPDDVKDWSERAQRAMNFLAAEVEDIFGNPINAERWKSVNPFHLAEKLEPSKAPAIYLDCGSEDRYGFDEGCRTLGKLLTDRHIPNTCEIRPGNHGWDYLKDAHPYALKWLKPILNKATASRPTGAR